MRAKAEQIETIGMMAAHESALADLYRAYADRLPEYAEFFRGLAADEVKHARTIAGFADDVKAGTVQVDPGRFSSASILSSLDLVRQCMAKAKHGEMSLLEALSTAKELEESLIERKYFEVLEQDGPDLRRLLETLAEETEAHRARLTEAWERERERREGE